MAAVRFGSSPTDEALKTWLEKKGIASTDVVGYRISRSPRESILTLDFFYDERPAIPPTDPDDLPRAYAPNE